MLSHLVSCFLIIHYFVLFDWIYVKYINCYGNYFLLLSYLNVIERRCSLLEKQETKITH